MFSSAGDNGAHPCEHTSALHPRRSHLPVCHEGDLRSFIHFVCHLFSLRLSLWFFFLSAPQRLSSSFLILTCSFLFTHCWTRCRLWNVNFSLPFSSSMKLGAEEDAENMVGFILLSTLISLSKCIFVWIHLAIFIIVFLPVYPFGLPCCLFSLFFVSLSFSLLVQPSAVLMKGWLM